MRRVALGALQGLSSRRRLRRCIGRLEVLGVLAPGRGRSRAGRRHAHHRAWRWNSNRACERALRYQLGDKIHGFTVNQDKDEDVHTCRAGFQPHRCPKSHLYRALCGCIGDKMESLWSWRSLFRSRETRKQETRQKTIPPDSWEHLTLEKPGEVEELICTICKPQHWPQRDPQHCRPPPLRKSRSLTQTHTVRICTSEGSPRRLWAHGSWEDSRWALGLGGPAQSSLFSFAS
ncbi:uncharacterized protein [Macaca nemestrina]|uniref:uncharacterized protein isoform X11 n=1 Tax=Macaca fascicularis TaxID=9541 RepID=UPI0032B08439